MRKHTPPMGWNSWNTFGAHISDELIRQTADTMVESGLLAAGYEYLVIDDCWSCPVRDAQGRLVPDPVKFPNGMKAVADYVHSKGLKFGMYSCCGNLTCAGYPGSYEYEFIDAQTFADWGVDFLKYDYCYHSKLLHSKYLYQRMGIALENTGRDILYSVCCWGKDDVHEWIKSTNATMWRSTGDIIDSWESIKDLAKQQKALHSYHGDGCFNDMDMLVVGMYGKGHVGLTGCNDEQYKTHFSLWAFLGSPLMIGCDIRQMNDATKAILMNPEMLRLHRDGSCYQPIPLEGTLPNDDLLLYYKRLDGGELAIGFFNLNDTDTLARVNLDEMGLPISTGKTLELTEVWSGETFIPANATLKRMMKPYESVVYRAKVVDA